MGREGLKTLSLKNLSHIEQNLGRNFKKKEHGENHGRLLNQLEEENVFLKDEIRRKGKVINDLSENFPNSVT